VEKKILIIGGTGYIGSALYKYLSTKFEVDTVDLELFGNYINPQNLISDYSELSSNLLNSYTHIVLLAAHSSVKMAIQSPREAFRNNLTSFEELLSKLAPDTDLIYASSSSVYSGSTDSEATEDWASYLPTNIYDFTKYASDCLAHISGKRHYALRFGTVCGESVNFRSDLMINLMVKTAIEEKVVRIWNGEVYRPILAIQDLVLAIEQLISHSGRPGIYNLASFNATIGEIGQAVANEMEVPLLNMGKSPTYNFRISSEKFVNEFKFRFSSTPQLIAQQIRNRWSDLNKGIRE